LGRSSGRAEGVLLDVFEEELSVLKETAVSSDTSDTLENIDKL
jgi:hypothetical protein